MEDEEGNKNEEYRKSYCDTDVGTTILWPPAADAVGSEHRRRRDNGREGVDDNDG